MNLKKNDKIIAVVGVIILVVAAIGIVLYSQEDETVPIQPPEEEKTFFEVKVEENDLSEPKTLSFGKKSFRLRKESIVQQGEFYTLPQLDDLKSIKSVKFNISYTDNKVKGLFGLLWKNVGKDTLDVTIKDPDGTKESIKQIKGSGKASIEFAVNPMIDCSPIESESMSEAQDILKSRIKDNGMKWQDQSFALSATHKVGEILRPLLRVRERFDTDSFDVDIIYTYYDYSLEDSGNEDVNDEISEENTDFDHNVGEFYSQLSYGKAMI